MFTKICLWPAICCLAVLLVLAGCVQPSPSTRFDMTLEHAETSPIPGASARIMPPPPGVAFPGAAVGACVTDAGYCPLAVQTQPGQNCLCTATNGSYGGTTAKPPITIPE